LGKENLPSGSRAAEQKQVREYVENETNQAIVKAVARISEEQGLKMNQTAVLWLMAKPYVTTMLLGGSRPEHFRQIYEVADRSLPEETVQELDELSAPRIYTPFHNQPFTNGPGLARHR
jgi:aryl-alcohol dehydrogenase-like predicted oxidoreductase